MGRTGVSRFDQFMVFIAAMIGWSHDAVGLTITNFVAVPIMEEFGVGEDLLGLVFSAQFIATVPGALLFGALADKYGRRMALFISVVWDSVFTALTFFAPSFLVLAVLRVISGLGVSWGIGYALLSETYSPRYRGFFGGLVHATFVLGYVISAASVSILYPLYGWRMPYLVALYPIPIVLILAKYLPESRVWLKLQELEEADEEAGGKFSFSKLLEANILKYVILASILFWGSEFAYHAWVDWAPTLLNKVYGFEVEVASEIVIGISLLVVFFLPVVGYLSDKIGRRKAFILSSSIGLIGSIVYAYLFFVTGDVDASFYLLYVIPLAFSAHSLYGVWSSEMFPTEVRATATSFIFSVARGLSLGAFIVGVASKYIGLAGSMFLFGLVGFILMVTLPVVLPETKGKVIE